VPGARSRRNARLPPALCLETRRGKPGARSARPRRPHQGRFGGGQSLVPPPAWPPSTCPA